MIKMRDLLIEIGDSSVKPEDYSMFVSSNTGMSEFKIGDIKYHCQFFTEVKKNLVKIKIQFLKANFSKDTLWQKTGENKPFAVMSAVAYSVTDFIQKYLAKYPDEAISVIAYSPARAADEPQIGNQRDRLYRVFIEKAAIKFKTNVNFTTKSGYVISTFSPPISAK